MEYKKVLTPEEVFMNALSEAERVEHLVICIYTKDGCYETWSNELPSHIRLGLLRECVIRVEKSMAEAEAVE